jgi:8-oxo-dGTP pyrophosphatase MutT (NUDIX family)
MQVVDKAFAYITRGNEVLVFRHVDFPDAGIQVPAGTVREGEPPAVAVVREAWEETGLDTFKSIRPLGLSEFDARPHGKDELHRRHFYHLPLKGLSAERWRYDELEPEGGGEAIAFELYWLSLAEAGEQLGFGHGDWLHALPKTIATLGP